VSRGLRSLVLHLALFAGAALTLAPLLWMVAASFMTSGEANRFPPPLLPSRATLEQYQTLFSRLSLWRPFMNSAMITVIVTLASTLIVSMAGYAFAKLRFPGRDRVFGALLLAIVIPTQVGMMPLFLMLQRLGLVNSLWAVVIPGLAPVFGIFMIRQYALSVPDDLLEAARMDGASELRIFWTIVMPLLRPILVTFAAFVFLSTWNDFMWPLIVLSDERRYTLPVALANLSGEHVQDTELMMAGSVLTIVPVVLLFVAFQRQYIRGVMMGSLKD
jgi:multiple sugar transport system permease protein